MALDDDGAFRRRGYREVRRAHADGVAEAAARCAAVPFPVWLRARRQDG